MSERLPVTDNADEFNSEAFGRKLFEFRDYTPIPLIILLLFVAKPSVVSATLGTLLMVIGELVRIYSVAFIGSISRTRSDNLGAKLVRTGPFAYVRNPLYCGNFFISTGIAVFGGVPWFVVITVALFSFQYYYIVKYEESLLAQKFGPDYETYRKEVGAWFPKRKIALEDLEWPQEMSKALRSERRTLSAIAACLVVLMLLSL